MSEIIELKLKREEGAQPYEETDFFIQFQEYKNSLMNEGRLIRWDRSDWVDNIMTITIEVDNMDTFIEMTDHSSTIGYPIPGYTRV